ncbi:hypothetical protein DK847_16595 [Aestuariivirga litoralis]|uniref:Uncharacterized protein n=1 Tax=Aestuariivirga litoralis TaxID=2650924 RepID=A0A2W2ATG6_9HYPH|nr:hypothetical protein DK847_16595 [Aestuariivirga litoralis]
MFGDLSEVPSVPQENTGSDKAEQVLIAKGQLLARPRSLSQQAALQIVTHQANRRWVRILGTAGTEQRGDLARQLINVAGPRPEIFGVIFHCRYILAFTFYDVNENLPITSVYREN